MKTSLKGYLRSWSRWYRLERSLRWGIRGLAIGLGLILVALLIGVLRGQIVADEFWLILVVGGGGALVVSLITGWSWPFPDSYAARFFDVRFNLRERVSTALELESDRLSFGQAADPAMVDQQHRDAMRAAALIRPQELMPLRLPRRELLAGVILALLAILLWFQGDSWFTLAEQRRAANEAIAVEEERLEELIEGIQTNPNLTPEQQQALAEPLQEAQQALGSSNNLEEAVSILQTTEKQLEAISDDQAIQQSQDLRDAGRQLNQNTDGPLNDFGQELSEGDIAAAADELDQVDVDSLDEQSQEDLARQLEEAAEQVEGNNPELAEDLRRAAEEVRNGNTDAAEQAMADAAQELNETAQQAAQAEAAQEAARDVRESEQRLVQSGQNAQETAQGEGTTPEGQGSDEAAPGDGSGENNQQGDSGQGQGQGEEGSGDEQSQSEGQGSSGSGQGTSEGSDSQGESVEGTGPIAQDNGAGDGGERGYEPISPPETPGGEDGSEVSLPGSDEPGDTVVGEGSPDPGAPGSGSVPYIEVFPEYDQAAREAIENGVVPPGLRLLVRDYFSSLEP
jgi:hypothetical protein